MLELTVTKQFGVSACCTFHTPDTCFIKNYDWKVNTQEERCYRRPQPSHTQTTHISIYYLYRLGIVYCRTYTWKCMRVILNCPPLENTFFFYFLGFRRLSFYLSFYTIAENLHV